MKREASAAFANWPSKTISTKDLNKFHPAVFHARNHSMSLNTSLAPNAMPCHANILPCFSFETPPSSSSVDPVRIFQRPKNRQAEGVCCTFCVGESYVEDT